MDEPRPPRLLDQVRERCRVKHYSIRTEAAYIDWIRRFILFHGKRHPREMGASPVEVTVRAGKGNKERHTVLPQSRVASLQQ